MSTDSVQTMKDHHVVPNNGSRGARVCRTESRSELVPPHLLTRVQRDGHKIMFFVCGAVSEHLVSDDHRRRRVSGESLGNWQRYAPQLVAFVIKADQSVGAKVRNNSSSVRRGRTAGRIECRVSLLDSLGGYSLLPSCCSRGAINTPQFKLS